MALFRSVIDLTIAIAAAGLALIVVAGGASFGVLSFHRAEKPILVLLVLVPVRVALGGSSWLTHAIDLARDRAITGWSRLSLRVSAAWADALFAMMTVSLTSWAAAFLANLVFPADTPRGFSLPFGNAAFVEIFAAWDSGWYWDIAAHGYYFSFDGQSSIAFFPLYPMLMRLVAAPFGGGDAATWLAGIAVALGAQLGALVSLHRLTERWSGSREVARRAVLYIAVFPWSWFQASVYSEALFLLTSVLAVSRAYEGRWWRAGWWGALATLTRPNGILVLVPLALLAAADRPGIRGLAARAGALMPIPLALAGFCAYAFVLTGDALAWLSAQAQWGYSLGHPPWRQLQRVIGDLVEHGSYGYFFMSEAAPIELLQVATALMFVVLAPFVVRRVGVALGAYVVVSLLVPLSSNALEGLGRYCSVLFPVFMLAGCITSARTHEAVVMASLVFRTLLICLFVTGHPVY